MNAQSEIFPIFVRAEYQENQTFARFQSDAQRAADLAKQEFAAVGQIIDQALSVERNSAGSLDLGVDELRAAAVAQEQRATAAREVADATLRAAQADGAFNTEMREGVQAARQYATEQERLSGVLQGQVVVQDAVQRELNETASATEGVINAQRRGTDSRGNVINSVRAERTAFIQLGQQMQDVTVQAQFGTNALQIFTQQAPQAAFALTGLANSADSTKARIGSLATFLSGPWGAALFAATAIVGPFVAMMFKAGDAADDTASSIEQLIEQKRKSVIETENATSAEAAFAVTLDGVTSALRENADAMEALNQLKKTSAESALDQANATFAYAVALQFENQQQLLNAQALLDAQIVRASGPGMGNELAALGLEGLSDDLDARINAFAEGSTRLTQAKAAISAAQARVSVELGQESSSDQINRRYNAMIDNAREAAEESGNVGKALQDEVAGIEAAREAELDRDKKTSSSNGSSRNTGAERAAREAQRLAEFGREAASEIEAIQNRFIEIPPEVAKVNQSVSSLDDLIAELGERKPANFEALIEQARTLREELADFGVEDALDNLFDGMREDTAFQLQQQRLILVGRDEEAEVLRTLRGLQEKYGDEALRYREEVENIVAARRREEDVIDSIGDKIDAYRSATQSVRQELEGLFSGEDFDLQGVFDQLSARISVEQLFGDALRRIDDAVVTSFDNSADELEENVERAGQSFDTVADEADDLAARLSAVRFDDPGTGTPGTSAGIGAEFDAAFGDPGAVAAANDNGIEVIGKATEKAADGVAGMDPNRYSVLLGEALTDPLLANLPPELAKSLSPVLSQAIGGLLTAGPVGGVLGGLSGLFTGKGPLAGALGDTLTGALGKAFGGAQTGQQTSLILDALGIGNSKTGSTVGGAIGGAVFGPAGSLAGSILGGLVGGLFKKTPDGNLGVTGVGERTQVRSRNAEIGQNLENLAGSLEETLQRIADELGTEVGAFSVSLGQRNDFFRVGGDANFDAGAKNTNGALYDGTDPEQALRVALIDAISDGAIAGLSAAEDRLLRAGNDFEKSLADVLTFRSVFDRLEGLQNPLRAEINALNSEFSQLIELFERAGASAEQFAQLEQLYDLERAQLVEEATDRIAGSLQDLIDDLTTGDNGFSLRQRRASAEEEFNDLRDRVEAGDTTAFDDFEDAARTLLDIEREIFGSQQGYFERLEEVLAASQQAVAEQEALIGSGSGFADPFSGSGNSGGVNTIGVSIAEQTNELSARLDAVNANLGRLGSIDQHLSNINQQFSSQRLLPPMAI